MNNQQALLDQIVCDNSQVELAKVLRCKPQFISNIRRGVANLPLPMWKKLIKKRYVLGFSVRDAIVTDLEDKLFKELGL